MPRDGLPAVRWAGPKGCAPAQGASFFTWVRTAPTPQCAGIGLAESSMPKAFMTAKVERRLGLPSALNER